MLSFILPMFPFILPSMLGVILICGLWLHDLAYRHQELARAHVGTK